MRGHRTARAAARPVCWGREKRGTSLHFGMSPCGKKCTACPSCLCLPPPLPCVCSRRTCLGPRGPQGRAGGRQASTSAYSRSRSTRVPPKRTARAGGRAARHGGGGSAARREGMQGWASERPRRGPFAASAACGVASTSAARADPPRRHPGRLVLRRPHAHARATVDEADVVEPHGVGARPNVHPYHAAVEAGAIGLIDVGGEAGDLHDVDALAVGAALDADARWPEQVQQDGVEQSDRVSHV